MMIPVASRMREVCAARKASATTGSRIGSSGSIGDGGTARVRHHDVLAGPDRVVPELLCERPDALEDLAAGVLVEREQPERRSGAHAGCACAQLSISRDPLITSSSSVTSTGTQLCPDSRFTSRRPGVCRKPGTAPKL